MNELTLKKQINTAKAKNLVFTSAGDKANVKSWLGQHRNWDLWICCYSDDCRDFINLADYYHEHKGGKFPNAFYAYKQWPEIFERYDAVFILDDDIIISNEELNQLFCVRTTYDLWLLQPSFSPKGKISHRLTKTRGFRKLTFTNFVEVCTVLFRQEQFSKFMKVYDPKLVGWGVDLWLMDYFHETKDKIAVSHEVTCINPHDSEKGGRREINTLQSQQTRERVWQEIKKSKEIADRAMCEYKTIWQAPSLSSIARGIYIEVQRKYYRYRHKIESRSGN